MAKIKRLAIWVDKPFCKDELFDPASPLNLDDRLAPFRTLKSELERRDWDCHTADVYLGGGVAPDIVLFLDIPRQKVTDLVSCWGAGVRKIVILFECEAIKPWNWDLTRHAEFDAIFTWNGDYVDNRKYFKGNFPYKFRQAFESDGSGKSKFCALVAGNKQVSHPLELYSERINAIRWFEGNHPAEFDLYGIGWDRKVFAGNLFFRALNRITPLTRLLAPRFPSYKGTISDKLRVLSEYKFSICYENARDIPGYITEKILDSICAGCVPVYWGASDIGAHIPENCFIDRRKFSSYEELYSYMKEMSEHDFKIRLSAMSEFIGKASAGEFSDTTFINGLVERFRAL